MCDNAFETDRRAFETDQCLRFLSIIIFRTSYKSLFREFTDLGFDRKLKQIVHAELSILLIPASSGKNQGR